MSFFTTWLGFTGKFEEPGPPSAMVKQPSTAHPIQHFECKTVQPSHGKVWATFDRSVEPRECSVGCGRTIPPGEVHARPHWPGPSRFPQYQGPSEEIQEGERKVVAGVYWCKKCFNESCASHSDEPFVIP